MKRPSMRLAEFLNVEPPVPQLDEVIKEPAFSPPTIREQLSKVK